MNLGATWRATAGPLDLVVDCEGRRHRIRWLAGSVVLDDHPDLDAERALVALGGDEPTCLEYLRLWDMAVADGGFLAEWVGDVALTPARLSWLGMALERMRTEGFHEFLRSLPRDRAQTMGRFIHRFPLPWIDRAAAEVAETVSDGPGVVCTHAPGLLSDAVATRLRRAFVVAVGGRQLAVGAAALVPLTITVNTVSGQDARPAIDGALSGPNRGVAVQVDRSWLHRVWAAGASVVDGALVLALADGEALVVGWADDGPGRPTTDRRPISFDHDRWVLGP